MTRERTRFVGVYSRKSEKRRHEGRPDVCFDITYKKNGKLIREKVGWLSEGYSAAAASHVRGERLRTIRHNEELPHEKTPAPLFKEVAKQYLEWAEANKSRGGIGDKSRYERWLKDRFDDKRMDEITALGLEDMKTAMAKAGMAPKTVAHTLGLVRSMYNRADDWGLYSGENPTRKVKKPTIDNKRTRFLTYEEAEILLEALRQDNRRKKNPGEMKDIKLHDIALFSLHTGARAGEIFNIRGSDVDFENGLISLYDTKNGETRHAHMTEALREILKERMPDKPSAYVFVDRNGEKIKEVSNAFERVVTKLKFNEGIKDPRQKISFHSLRHTFASWLALQGETIQTIADLLGHKSIQMTMRYAHLSPDHKKRAVMALENGFKEERRKAATKAEASQKEATR